MGLDVKQKIGALVATGAKVPVVANTPVDKMEVGEILSERTLNAKVFPTGIPGQRNAKVYAYQIHWGEKGNYKTQDLDVKRKPLFDPKQEYPYEAKTGIYHAHFKEDKPHDYRMEIWDSWIEYEALFDESKSLTVKVETTRTGIKETITLKDDKAPTSLSWRVSRSGTGIVTLPPTAKDAKGNDVLVKVTEDGETLTYEVDVKGAVFPIVIDPTSVIATNDGLVRNVAADTYTNVRDAATGGTAQTSQIGVGQNVIVSYYIFRGFASFAIPDMSACTACSLFLEGKEDNSTTDFGVYIHTSTYSNPITEGDYDLFDGHQASGIYNGTVLNNTWNSSSYSPTWNEFVFNAAGLAVVLAAKNTTLRLVLISKEDYDNSAPTDSEYIYFESSATAGKEPYLSLTYTSTVAPTVTTQAASDVAATTCTGNGNITNTGGANCTRRGFCYKVGTSGDPTTADSVAYDDGDYGTGAYTKAITGLTGGTGYRIRAYAVNSAGTGYGDTVQITTVNQVTAGGELTFTGGITRNTGKALSGVFTPTGTLNRGMFQSLTGALTFLGTVSPGRIFTRLLTGILSFVGVLSGGNPDWLEIHPWQTWKGEWDAAVEYITHDVVLYQDGNNIHAFVSKTDHNTGNLPTDSAHWTRLIQEGWRT